MAEGPRDSLSANRDAWWWHAVCPLLGLWDEVERKRQLLVKNTRIDTRSEFSVLMLSNANVVHTPESGLFLSISSAVWVDGGVVVTVSLADERPRAAKGIFSAEYTSQQTLTFPHSNI